MKLYVKYLWCGGSLIVANSILVDANFKVIPAVVRYSEEISNCVASKRYNISRGIMWQNYKEQLLSPSPDDMNRWKKVVYIPENNYT
jgi:hypothetical protein